MSSVRSDRSHAASILREARRCLALDLDASEACHWALIFLPASRAAQRSMIDWLLRCGALDDAAALLSAALLQHGESDWKLWLRRARILLAQQRADDASAAIARSLALQPRRFEPLLLAADIARAQNDHDRALHWLERAAGLRSREARLAPRMIDSLLALDRPDDAAAVLEQMDEPPADLAARVLMAQGRVCDARAVLESALKRTCEEDALLPQAMALQLLDVLERSGDWPALRVMAQNADRSNDDPILAARLANALLSMGEHAAAAHLCRGIIERAGERPDVLATLAVASAAMNDGVAATQHVISQRANIRARVPAAACAQASIWLRGLLGVIVAEQCDPRAARRAGADPSASVLESLLRRSLNVFDAAIDAQPESAHAARWRALRQQCAQAVQPLPSQREDSAAPSPITSTDDASDTAPHAWSLAA